jgi:argininosuccinate lyase
MNIEARLTELIGVAGKKLHTGRSRNDQVATDLRLYLRDETDRTIELISLLQANLLDLAETEVETILPGLTHLQTAQPVSFAHHLLAWFEMLQRDGERFTDCQRRTNIMPLGAAALAGTSFPIDREFTASELKFDEPCRNSLDAVSDRDFVIEFAAAASLTMMHLSRMCEEIILWASERYRFIQISDAFCTGSSIMPQKKNPDIAELIRGKSSRVIGHLTGLLVLMKSQPLAYNRDNQEDKEPLFDVVDTLQSSLQVFAAMIPDVTVNRENMYTAALQGFATATDLAEYLVRKNVAFRDAHEIVGRVVNYAFDNGRNLPELTLGELREFSEDIDDDIFDVLTLEGSINARDHVGGTAPGRVREALAHARKLLGA